MAEKIKRIGVRLSRRLGEVSEVDASFCKCNDDLIALFRICPTLAQLMNGWKERSHAFCGVFGVANDAQLLAVMVTFVSKTGCHLDLTAIKVELAAFIAWRFRRGRAAVAIALIN